MDRSLVRRRAGRVFLGAIGGLTVVTLAIVASLSLPRPQVMASEEIQPAAPHEIDAVLRSAGITPDTLAAAGANETLASLMLTPAANAAAEDIAAYRDAHAAMQKAQALLQPLERLAASGLATDEQMAELSSARATLEAAGGALNAWLLGIRVAALEAASGPVAANLATICDTECSVPLAPAYDLGKLSLEDRVTLHRLLRAKAAAQSSGEAFPSELQELLSTYQSNTAIAGAIQDWELNIDGVKAAWNDAIGGFGD